VLNSRVLLAVLARVGVLYVLVVGAGALRLCGSIYLTELSIMLVATLLHALTACIGAVAVLVASCGSAAAPQVHVQVTTNADAGTGSLREALMHVRTGERVTFNPQVGTIRLLSGIELTTSGVTVDAVGSNVTVDTSGRYPLTLLGVTNVTVRGLRFRGGCVPNNSAPSTSHLGSRPCAPHEADAQSLAWSPKHPNGNLRVSGACSNVTIEYCSSTGTDDVGLDITHDYKSPQNAPKDITVQYCILGQNIKTSLTEGAGPHISFHHNVWSGADMRSPQLDNVTLFDISNNVVAGWWEYGSRIRADSSGNLRSNVFCRSRSSTKDPSLAVVLEASHVFASGNLGPMKEDGSRVDIDGRATSSEPLWNSPLKHLDDPASLLEKLHEVVGPRPLDAMDLALLEAAHDACSTPSTPGLL